MQPQTGSRGALGRLELPEQLTRRNLLKAATVISAVSAVGLTACSSSATPQASASPVASPTLPKTVSNADEAGQLVLQYAKYGASVGSYAIAGALIHNATGNVIGAVASNVLFAIQNRVNQFLDQAVTSGSNESFPFDPTAHGERQLTYWYFENRKKLNLPDPQDITLVTSLDPCAMCTGTVLAAGFNVGVFAIDPFAGINFNSTGTFVDLPEPLRAQAKRRFGYYGTQGGRAYVGGPSVAFSGTLANQSTLDDCYSVYKASSDNVLASRKGSDTDPSQLVDPATNPQAAAVISAYQQACPSAFSIKLANYRQPTPALHALLKKLRDTTPGAKSAAAYVDPFGNVLSAFADSMATDPVATALQNVIQAYSQTRFNLTNSSSTHDIALKSLTSAKYGTFVFLNAPSPRVATSFADLGAYGLTVGTKAPVLDPSPFQYFEPPLSGTVSELRKVIAAMPPLYSQLVAINPQPVR